MDLQGNIAYLLEKENYNDIGTGLDFRQENDFMTLLQS